MALSTAASGAYGALNGYWGQFSTDRLADYCDTGIEYVTLAFVNKAPENDESGYPGTNFAGHCWYGYYDNEEGVTSPLLSNCVYMKTDIPYCKEKGVKILLSIGGEYTAESDYKVTTEDNGEYFAEFLYSAFGPYDPSWDGPRPFDASETEHVAVDGFDFDIEAKFDNKPYIAMIEKFRELDSSIIITGAPQCPTSNAYFYMKEMIQKASFDALFIQFYNNLDCDAIELAPLLPGVGFNLDDWEDIIAASDKSKDAKLFIGLPASPRAAGSGYIPPSAMKDLVCEYKDNEHFGGISLWDISYGAVNVVNGKTYNQHVLDALQYGCDPVPTTTTTTTSAMSTTSTSTSTSTSTTTTTSATSTSTTATSTSTTATSTSTTATSTSTSATSTSTSATSTSTSATSTSTSATSTSTTSSPTVTSTSTSTSLSSTVGWGNSTTTTTTTSASSSASSSSSSTSRIFSFTTTSWPNATTTSTSASTPSITSTGTSSWTTSTAYTTTTRTITDCPDYVVDCPEGGYTTTEVIPIYTTVCPVTETGEEAMPTPTEGAGWTTSTVYTTVTKTTTDCPDYVVDCPKGGYTTTMVIPVSTTVCPITETGEEAMPTPTEGAGSETTEGGEAVPTGEFVEVASESTSKFTKTIYTTLTESGSSTTMATVVTQTSVFVPTTKPSAGAPIPTGAWTGTAPSPSPDVPVAAAVSGRALSVTVLGAVLALQAFLL